MNGISFYPEALKRAYQVSAPQTFTTQDQHCLIDWKQITGLASWGLNSFALGCFALQISWENIGGKALFRAHVPMLGEIKLYLREFNSALEDLTGKHFTNLSLWYQWNTDSMS